MQQSTQSQQPGIKLTYDSRISTQAVSGISTGLDGINQSNQNETQQHQSGRKLGRDPRFHRQPTQVLGTGLTDIKQSNQDEIEQQDFDVGDQNYVVDQEGIRINSVLQSRAGPGAGYQLGGSTNPTQTGQDDRRDQNRDQNNNNNNNNNNNKNSGNGGAGRSGRSNISPGGGDDDDGGDDSDDSKGDDLDGSSVSMSSSSESESESESEEEDNDVLGLTPGDKLKTKQQRKREQKRKHKNENKKLRKQLADQRKRLDDLLAKSKSGGPPGVGGAPSPSSAGVAASPDVSIYHNLLQFQQDQLQNMMRCANSKQN